jgi:uncharacterized protein (DUF1501 family)
MTITRRDLLSKGALLVASGLVAPSFITRTALALSQSTTSQNRVLVVVQLSGGNDGLNTVVPYGFPEYYQLRSTLAVPAGDVLPIADRIGLHPNLAEFKSLFDQAGPSSKASLSEPTSNLMDVWRRARALGLGRWPRYLAPRGVSIRPAIAWATD